MEWGLLDGRDTECTRGEERETQHIITCAACPYTCTPEDIRNGTLDRKRDLLLGRNDSNNIVHQVHIT